MNKKKRSEWAKKRKVCENCGILYTRSNWFGHRNTQKHKTVKEFRKAIRELVEENNILKKKSNKAKKSSK